jgi:hypothetical protein
MWLQCTSPATRLGDTYNEFLFTTLTEFIHQRIDLFCSACLVRVEQTPGGLSYLETFEARSKP